MGRIAEIGAAPTIPPAMVAAQPTSTELGEMSDGVAFGFVHVAEVIPTVGAQAAAFAFPELVETTIGIQAAASIETAGNMALDPLVTRAKSSHPAVVAAHPELAEMWERCFTLDFHIAVTVASPRDGVAHVKVPWGELGVVG